MPLPIEIDAFYRKWEHRWQHGHENSFLEKKFIEEVFCFALHIGEIENLEPQYRFIDDLGGNRFIDFVLHVNGKKLAIELDGITKLKNEDGAIDPERFNDFLIRQNSLLKNVDDLVRYSHSHIVLLTTETRSGFRQRVELHKKNRLSPNDIAERIQIDNENFRIEVRQQLNQKPTNEDIKQIINELLKQFINNSNTNQHKLIRNKRFTVGVLILVITVLSIFLWKIKLPIKFK
ncbi:MAG: hypothetical protein IPM69_14985 [Ignavibacteria bacterium]|nr:hypothetical protein [Ignavibacteria bacterium]